MPFGIVGRTGPGMRQMVGFGDRSTGRGTFGANLGRAIVTNKDLLLQRRGPLPKLLWADLLLLTSSIFCVWRRAHSDKSVLCHEQFLDQKTELVGDSLRHATAAYESICPEG